MDLWNPETFDTALLETLAKQSNLISDYHAEDKRLMDEHLNSDPYESLKPNKFYSSFSSILEHTLIPMMRERRIRVWHYTRLLDDEVSLMKKCLKPSTPADLSQRLEALRNKGLLTQQEAQTVYVQSALHRQPFRYNRFFTTTVPLPPNDPGVVPLLESWGGEAAYFWLSDETVGAKLKAIGKPRVIEIETAIENNPSAYSSAETVVQAWAKSLGVTLRVSGADMAIMECLDTAKVLHVHTAGDGEFENVGTKYPSGFDKIMAD